MEISRKNLGGIMEIRLNGRLDAYWADHLDQEMSAVVREGFHRISLQMADLTYMSSAGIRILVKYLKQLKSLHGFLTITEPSREIVKILEITGMESLFQLPSEAGGAESKREPGETYKLDLPNLHCDVMKIAKTSMECRTIGEAHSVSWEKASRSLSLPQNAMVVGIGALGNGFFECRERFGELMAVAGAVAYQPTDRRNIPDYIVTRDGMLSGIEVLHGLCCEGGFSHRVHFESKQDKTVSLLDIAKTSLEILKADAAAIVMAAEVRGLIGASLKRSPAVWESDYNPFRHPEIQERMSYTVEPAYGRSVALVTGVALSCCDEPIISEVRQLSDSEWPRGHFHAAAFTYRPLPKGNVELSDTVRTLMEEEVLLGILHLVNDTRPIEGVGQSEFVRGICWISPISNLQERKVPA